MQSCMYTYKNNNKTTKEADAKVENTAAELHFQKSQLQIQASL